MSHYAKSIDFMLSVKFINLSYSYVRVLLVNFFPYCNIHLQYYPTQDQEECLAGAWTVFVLGETFWYGVLWPGFLLSKSRVRYVGEIKNTEFKKEVRRRGKETGYRDLSCPPYCRYSGCPNVVINDSWQLLTTNFLPLKRSLFWRGGKTLCNQYVQKVWWVIIEWMNKAHIYMPLPPYNRRGFQSAPLWGPIIWHI